MKICMVSPFGFQAATTRVRAHNFARHLVRLGDDVLFLTAGKIQREEGNLKIVGVGKAGGGVRNLLTSSLSKYFTLRNLKNIEVYHCFKALPWASLPTWLAKRGGKAVIDLDDLEAGSALDQGHKLATVLIRFFEFKLPKLFNGVVVVSELLKQKCIDAGVPEERIVKIPYGADVEMFAPMLRDEELAKEIGVEGKRVVYVGSIGELNLRILVEAMKTVRREVKDAVLLAVSPGWNPERFRNYVTRLGLPEKAFIVLGRQPHELMPRILSVADIVYVPNRFIEVDEARSPSRVGEYMAAGKAIVANAVGVVKEQLSDRAGALVYSYEPNELASQIIEILQNEKLAKRLGKTARKKAEKVYSWNILAKRLREFYAKIGG